jgi:hypothetical protein
MSRRLGKMIGIAVLVLCAVALVVGVALLGKAYTMPAHVDERKAQQLTDSYAQRHFDMSPQERVQREGEIVNLRTAKWPLYNIGVSICLAAATFAVAIVRFRLWDMRNLKIATTPRTRLRLIGLASIAWLALIPAAFVEINDEFFQDDLFPHNGYGVGGTSGLFLVTGVPLIVVIWTLATLICRFLVLRNVNLPATLWQAGYSRSSRNVALTVFYGAMIGLLAASVAWSAVYYIWAIPSGLIGIYVMLSSRAGLLSRKVHNPKDRFA